MECKRRMIFFFFFLKKPFTFNRKAILFLAYPLTFASLNPDFINFLIPINPHPVEAGSHVRMFHATLSNQLVRVWLARKVVLR